jgi:hypothetical protein
LTDFNVLTINGKVFPATAPLICKTGDKVRIRFANLGATDHHPMHLHGHHFRVTATDGEEIPLSAQWPETTVLVGVGQSRNIEFIADAPGDWALHCHMTHHLMNQMGHEFPNMVGVDPGDLDKRIQSLLPAYMTMGTTGMDMGEHAGMMSMAEYHRDEKCPRAFGPHVDGRLSNDSQGPRQFAELRRRPGLVSTSNGNRGTQGERRRASPRWDRDERPST